MATIKVCGLTRLDQVQELIVLNTDFLGFIFYEKSPRYVLNHLSLEGISEIQHQGKVGVFVNESNERIIEISEKADLNLIQLHGDESEDFIIKLKQKIHPKIKIIQVIRIGNQPLNELQKSINQNLSAINYFLFDTDSKTFGGTGKTFDWNIVNTLEIPLPYFLSGGISEDNIENIKQLKQKPFALDINSKFETKPGDKDTGKIKDLYPLYYKAKENTGSEWINSEDGDILIFNISAKEEQLNQMSDKNNDYLITKE